MNYITKRMTLIADIFVFLHMFTYVLHILTYNFLENI